MLRRLHREGPGSPATFLSFGHIDMEGMDSKNVHQPVEEAVIRRYLLQDPSMTPEERAAFESSFFSDDELHLRLLEVEDDLVDEHVSGEMSPADSVLFEESLKRSARWQNKVALTRSLVHYASEHSTNAILSTLVGWLRSVLGLTRPRALALAVAAAATVIVTVSVFLLQNTLHLRHPDSLPATAHVNPPPVVTSQESPQPLPGSGQQPRPARKTPAPVLAFLLVPELTRSQGEPTTLKMPAGDYIVRLRMNRGDELLAGYEATLSTPEKTIIFHREHLKPSRSGKLKTVVLTIPAGRLVPGAYILSLRGEYADGHREGLDDYSFQVERP
jgi:hypothetical protein